MIYKETKKQINISINLQIKTLIIVDLCRSNEHKFS